MTNPPLIFKTRGEAMVYYANKMGNLGITATFGQFTQWLLDEKVIIQNNEK